MATFADMMSLLLTFFVLLLSFAEMDVEKFKDALGSINSALGFTSGGTGMLQHTTSPTSFEKPMTTSVSQPQTPISNNETITKELNEIVSSYGLQDDVEIKSSERGVILRVRGKLFFNPGTATLRYESQPVLDKIAELMKQHTSKVSIEGHTDNIPISGGTYSNNWELSTARAYSTLKFLQENEDVNVKNINIAGFGDTHPIAPNDTPEGRAKNRRVEFVFFGN